MRPSRPELSSRGRGVVIRQLLARFARTVMPSQSVYFGWAARNLAREMASRGETGVVIEVRFPTLNAGQQLHGDWYQVRVWLNGRNQHDFRPTGSMRWPYAIAHEPPGICVVEVNNDGLVRLDYSFNLRPDVVQVITVLPRLTKMSRAWRDPKVALGDRFTAERDS